MSTFRPTRNLKPQQIGPKRRKSPQSGAFPKVYKPKPVRMLEKTLQKLCLGWMALQWPRTLIYHVPNGGKRNLLEALDLKRQGVKSGVPDLVVPAMRGGYGGLYIELKVGKNTLSETQKQWIEALRDEGYYVAVCRTLEEFQAVVTPYLSGATRRVG